jgi:sodium transport system permease protein
LNWSAVRQLYLAELRAALRERAIVVNSLLMPALLYPVLLWLLFNGIMFVQGQAEGMVSRVYVSTLPSEHRGLLAQLAAEPKIEILDSPELDVEEALGEESIDAALRFRDVDDGLHSNFEVIVLYDSSRERSAVANSKLHEVLAEYRNRWLEAEIAPYLSGAEWQDFGLESRNVASAADMGAMILGLVLPLYFVVMVAVGCMYPAVDSTAGERERNTWETTLTMAVPRLCVVTAKYLYVTTLGFVAGALNLAAMALTMGSVIAPLLGESERALEFRVPPPAIPLLLLGSLLLAASVAAAMMLFAVFARTFKEGQAMVVPIYALTFMPVLFLTREGLALTPRLALVPVVNVAMMVRDALSGTFATAAIALTFAVQLVVIVILLRLAATVLRHEEVITGNYEGNLLRFLRRRVRSSAAGAQS